MTQSELQHRLDGTKEQESFAISPRLDTMIRTLTEPERKIFLGKIWSLERVYSGATLYRKINLLVRATFAATNTDVCKKPAIFIKRWE